MRNTHDIQPLSAEAYRNVPGLAEKVEETRRLLKRVAIDFVPGLHVRNIAQEAT